MLLLLKQKPMPEVGNVGLQRSKELLLKTVYHYLKYSLTHAAGVDSENGVPDTEGSDSYELEFDLGDTYAYVHDVVAFVYLKSRIARAKTYRIKTTVPLGMTAKEVQLSIIVALVSMNPSLLKAIDAEWELPTAMPTLNSIRCMYTYHMSKPRFATLNRKNG